MNTFFTLKTPQIQKMLQNLWKLKESTQIIKKKINTVNIAKCGTIQTENVGFKKEKNPNISTQHNKNN